MSKILGIDYGTKLIGIAITDEAQKLVFPRATIGNKGQSEVLSELKKLIDEENVESLVVGNPLHMEGNRSDFNNEVQVFASELQKVSGKEVYLVDERLTTEQVERERKMMGLYGRKNKYLKDEIAASIILTVYLENRRKEKV